MPKRISTTPKPRFGLFRTLILGVAALSALFAVGSAAFSSARSTQVRAESSTPWAEEEKLVDGSELRVIIREASLTESSESLTVTFASKRVEAWPNGARNQNVFVVPLDGEWKLDEAKKEAAAAKEQGLPAPHYEVAVYSIRYNAGQTRVVVPSTVSYGNQFVFDVTTISANVCNVNDIVTYDRLSEIVIPKTVTTIEEGAFPDMPEDVTIYCEAPSTDEEGNPTYPEAAFTTAPKWDTPITDDIDIRRLNVSTTIPKTMGTGTDFFITYKDGNFDLPAYMEYELEDKATGAVVSGGPHSYTLPILSTNNPYNGVGSTLGFDTIRFELNIPMDPQYRLKMDSVLFHNIYYCIDGETLGSHVPDLSRGPMKASPLLSLTYVSEFSEYFDFETTQFNSFGKYFQVNTLFKQYKNDAYGVYPHLKPSIFEQQKANLDSGDCYIRYQLTGLDRASYRFTFKNGDKLEAATKDLDVPRLNNYVGIGDKKTRVGFLVDSTAVEGIDPQTVQSVELIGFTVTLDIYSKRSKGLINQSAVTVRFASLQLMPDVAAVPHMNLATVMLITYLIYVLAFAAVAFLYYAYAKRKYRNDEFRRMNTKKYIQAALKNFLGLAFVVSAFLFVICRWGVFESTIITHNPLDAFVIIFVIAAGIYVGFTIRNFAVSIKNARKRKQAARLHLDQDEVEDGTK